MLLRPSVEARLIPGDGRAYENALGGRRMTLSTQEQMLIEQRVANEAKSTGLAYVLWFFLGGLGMHRFYLGRPMSGLILLLMVPAGIVMMLTQNRYGAFVVIIGVLWLIVDAFLIPGMVNRSRDKVRRTLTGQALSGR
jgi:TM2 domain-containing membrane protein YozV